MITSESLSVPRVWRTASFDRILEFSGFIQYGSFFFSSTRAIRRVRLAGGIRKRHFAVAVADIAPRLIRSNIMARRSMPFHTLTAGTDDGRTSIELPFFFGTRMRNSHSLRCA